MSKPLIQEFGNSINFTKAFKINAKRRMFESNKNNLYFFFI
ncbi:hypothetical protein [Polaribacter cellanae]|nr:hypothetical protein [Polaribacter cellanae]